MKHLTPIAALIILALIGCTKKMMIQPPPESNKVNMAVVSSLATVAQRWYWHSIQSEYNDNCTIAKGDSIVLAMGDSFIDLQEGIPLWKQVYAPLKVLNRAQGGGMWRDHIAMIDSCAKSKYKVRTVFVHLGTNDRFVHVTTWKQDMIKFLVHLHNTYPTAEIGVCEVELSPLLLKQGERDDVIAMNVDYKQVVDSLSKFFKIRLISTASTLSDINGFPVKSYYAIDSIHPSAGGGGFSRMSVPIVAFIKGSTGTSGVVTQPQPPTPPVTVTDPIANAGTNASASDNQIVKISGNYFSPLNACRSTSKSSWIAAGEWRQVSGRAVKLLAPNKLTCSVEDWRYPGVYVFEVSITNGRGIVGKDQVAITVVK